MRGTVVGVLVLAVLGCTGVAREEAPAPRPVVPPREKGIELPPVVTWPRAPSVGLGCLMSRAGGYVDPMFACGAPDRPRGDPCKFPDTWTAGPEFPPDLTSQLEYATAVHLEWEHGNLRVVTVTLAPGTDEAAARKAYQLDGALPDNVLSAVVQPCGKDTLCVVIQGFEHRGPEDAGCSAG